MSTGDILTLSYHVKIWDSGKSPWQKLTKYP